MNVDEKAKLVTNENFQMISDERNSSRINLNKQPDRTLSSFLFESQFYENLQIVRWVVKSLFVVVWFQTWITAQRLFSRLSKKTTWSQTWDLTRREGGLPSSRPLRIPPCLILSIPTSEPRGNIPVSCISISVHDLTWLRHTNFHSIPRCSSMLEPNSLRSHEFESDDWINGNWQTARKSDTLLVRFQFPILDWIPHQYVSRQKLDDLSIRESDSSNPEENITLFLDMHHEDMEMERRRWARWRRCHFFTLSLCAVSAILSLICIAAFVLTILQNQWFQSLRLLKENKMFYNMHNTYYKMVNGIRLF